MLRPHRTCAETAAQNELIPYLDLTVRWPREQRDVRRLPIDRHARKPGRRWRDHPKGGKGADLTVSFTACRRQLQSCIADFPACDDCGDDASADTWCQPDPCWLVAA